MGRGCLSLQAGRCMMGIGNVDLGVDKDPIFGRMGSRIKENGGMIK